MHSRRMHDNFFFGEAWEEGGQEVYTHVSEREKIKSRQSLGHSPNDNHRSQGSRSTRPREEHPSVLRAAAYYQQLGGKCFKPTKEFLPMAQKRYVKINAAEDSMLTLDFDVAKRQYEGVVSHLNEATSDLIDHFTQSLSKDALMAQSEDGLRNKAERKMLLDGVKNDVAHAILDEMPRLFRRPKNVAMSLAEEHRIELAAAQAEAERLEAARLEAEQAEVERLKKKAT